MFAPWFWVSLTRIRFLFEIYQHHIDTLCHRGWQHKLKSSPLQGKFKIVTQLVRKWWATFLLPAAVKTSQWKGEWRKMIHDCVTGWPNYIWTTLLGTHPGGRSLSLSDKWFVLQWKLNIQRNRYFCVIKETETVGEQQNLDKRDISALLNRNPLTATFSAHHKNFVAPFLFSSRPPFFWAVSGLSPNPQFYFSPLSASLSLFLPDIWLDSQPHTKTNVMTSLRCNVPQTARASQRERGGVGGIKEITPKRNAGEVQQKKWRNGVEVLAEGENSGRQDLYSAL